jgi:hypothetical protein
MLEIYGPGLVEYRGIGRVRMKTGGALEGPFHCVQLNDSRILIELTMAHIVEGNIEINLMGIEDMAREFEGRLEEGGTIKTEGWVAGGKINVNWQEGMPRPNFRILVEAEQIIVKRESDAKKEPKLLVFPLTNLRFQGTSYFLRADMSQVALLQLRIGGVKATILPEENFLELLEQMEATRISTITAFLEVECDGKEVQEIIEIVDNLCTLLSFAAGTRVTWLYYHEVNEQNWAYLARHRTTMTGLFSRYGVIQLSEVGDLKLFIEGVYDEYLKQNEQYKVSDIIETLVQAKSSSNFGELDGLIIGSAVDVLRAEWATKNGREWIIENASFEAKLKDLKDEIKKIVINIFGISNSKASDMKSKAKELNRPAFRTVLEAMLRDFGANELRGEVQEFIDSRDMLVHQGKFKTEEVDRELRAMFSFSDRLIIAILGYKGPYYDWKIGQRIEQQQG